MIQRMQSIVCKKNRFSVLTNSLVYTQALVSYLLRSVGQCCAAPPRADCAIAIEVQPSLSKCGQGAYWASLSNSTTWPLGWVFAGPHFKQFRVQKTFTFARQPFSCSDDHCNVAVRSEIVLAGVERKVSVKRSCFVLGPHVGASDRYGLFSPLLEGTRYSYSRLYQGGIVSLSGSNNCVSLHNAILYVCVFAICIANRKINSPGRLSHIFVHLLLTLCSY